MEQNKETDKRISDLEFDKKMINIELDDAVNLIYELYRGGFINRNDCSFGEKIRWFLRKHPNYKE